MIDSNITAYTSNTITSNATATTGNTIISTISDLNTIASNLYTDPYTYTTSTLWTPAKAGLETDSNELKINIKKFQIKFNFNL